jgi:ABC-type transport system involved in cytochrome c biogenesis permease component
VILVLFHAGKQDLPTGVQFPYLFPATMVQFLEDKSIGNVERVLLKRVDSRVVLVLGKIVQQVEFNDIRLFLVVDLVQLLLEHCVDALHALVVVVQIRLELFIGCFCFRF